MGPDPVAVSGPRHGGVVFKGSTEDLAAEARPARAGALSCQVVVFRAGDGGPGDHDLSGLSGGGDGLHVRRLRQDEDHGAVAQRDRVFQRKGRAAGDGVGPGEALHGVVLIVQPHVGRTVAVQVQDAGLQGLVIEEGVGTGELTDEVRLRQDPDGIASQFDAQRFLPGQHGADRNGLPGHDKGPAAEVVHGDADILAGIFAGEVHPLREGLGIGGDNDLLSLLRLGKHIVRLVEEEHVLPREGEARDRLIRRRHRHRLAGHEEGGIRRRRAALDKGQAPRAGPLPEPKPRFRRVCRDGDGLALGVLAAACAARDGGGIGFPVLRYENRRNGHVAGRHPELVVRIDGDPFRIGHPFLEQIPLVRCGGQGDGIAGFRCSPVGDGASFTVVGKNGEIVRIACENGGVDFVIDSGGTIWIVRRPHRSHRRRAVFVVGVFPMIEGIPLVGRCRKGAAGIGDAARVCGRRLEGKLDPVRGNRDIPCKPGYGGSSHIGCAAIDEGPVPEHVPLRRGEAAGREGIGPIGSIVRIAIHRSAAAAGIEGHKILVFRTVLRIVDRWYRNRSQRGIPA